MCSLIREGNVIRVKHPLVEHHLMHLRDERTDSETFRHLIARLTMLLAYEATRDLGLVETTIQTPVAEAAGRVLRDRIGVIPILRAGVGMVEPVLAMLPEAEVWHLGIYRDEQTLQPVPYYQKLPSEDAVDDALVLDPMLATGGSAVAALDAVRSWGVKRIKMLIILAAPEGLERVANACPEAEIYVCGIDSHLNDRGYIVPGLGDAGDRMFNAPAR